MEESSESLKYTAMSTCSKTLTLIKKGAETPTVSFSVSTFLRTVRV